MGLSRERVGEELTKSILEGESPADYFRLLTESGLIYEIAPEFKGMETVFHDNRGTHYGESIYQHTLDVLGRLGKKDTFEDDPYLVLTLAAMFHDIGKMVTVSEEEGKIRFLKHESVSAEYARLRLTALRFPTHIVNAVVRLVALHMKLNNMSEKNSQLPRKQLSRLFVYDLPLEFSTLGGLYQLMELCNADQNTRLTFPDHWGPDYPLLKGTDILNYTEPEGGPDGTSLELVTPERIRGKVLKHLHYLQLSQHLKEEELRKLARGVIKTFIAQEEGKQ